VAISGIRFRDPAKDLKAIEESPKKPMASCAWGLGVEEDAHVFEKKEWALCACV